MFQNGMIFNLNILDAQEIPSRITSKGPSTSCCSVAQLCPTLYDPMDHSTPRPHSILKFAQNSCSLHRWYHLATSSFSTLFSFYSQSFPASGTFPVSRLFTSGDRNTGASALASVLPMNIPLRLTGLISLLSEGHSEVFFSTTAQRHHGPGLTTGKTIVLTIQPWPYPWLCRQSGVSFFKYTV